MKLYCSVDLRASPSTPVLLNVLVVAGTMDVHSESCGSFSVGTMTIFTNAYDTKIRGMLSALLIILLEATRTSICSQGLPSLSLPVYKYLFPIRLELFNCTASDW